MSWHSLVYNASSNLHIMAILLIFLPASHIFESVNCMLLSMDPHTESADVFPDEILLAIFYQLPSNPLDHAWAAARATCTRWRDIVSSIHSAATVPPRKQPLALTREALEYLISRGLPFAASFRSYRVLTRDMFDKLAAANNEQKLDVKDRPEVGYWATALALHKPQWDLTPLLNLRIRMQFDKYLASGDYTQYSELEYADLCFSFVRHKHGLELQRPFNRSAITMADCRASLFLAAEKLQPTIYDWLLEAASFSKETLEFAAVVYDRARRDVESRRRAEMDQYSDNDDDDAYEHPRPGVSRLARLAAHSGMYYGDTDSVWTAGPSGSDSSDEEVSYEYDYDRDNY